MPIGKILEDAMRERKRLSIEYISSENSDGLGYKKSRLIDIYEIKRDSIEAFCHLRQGLRNFRISRILKAELTNESYSVPQDFQNSLF